MMTRKARILAGGLATAILCFSSTGAGVRAQGANPTMDSIKSQYAAVKTYLAKTVAKVPEDVLAFKPTPEVRSFGQILAHIADSQFGMCGTAAGEKKPSDFEKTATTKAASKRGHAWAMRSASRATNSGRSNTSLPACASRWTHT